MAVRERSTLATLSVAVLVGLVGCTSATAGQPKPTGTETQASEEPTTETTSTTEAPEYSLARLCELMSGDEAVDLGGSPEGEESNSVSDGHKICTWADATQLILGFQDGPTTADVRTGPGVTNTPTTIDGLTAVQSFQTDPTTMCQILVDLPSGKLFTSAARVRSSGAGKYDPCEVATELSNLIIPRVKDQ